jgi:hypothetical protein
MTEQRLRQQSHPLARIWRDFKVSNNPLLLVVLSGTFLLGTALVLLQGLPTSQPSSTQLLPIEKVKR